MMMSREERLRRLREIYADVDTPAQRSTVDSHDAVSPTALRSVSARASSKDLRPEGGISDAAAAVIAQALKTMLDN